jgi:alpha-L-rhamnosidase
MKIIHCKLNHLTNPLGWDVAHPTVSYVVTGAKGRFQQAARVWVSLSEDFSDCLYDSGERADIVSTGFELPVPLFCATGDKIEIDTRTLEYRNRVK